MPLHEIVQPAQVAHELVARTQVEVIGVAQDKSGVDVFEMFGRESLDGRLCANRREDRREQVAVRCSENACTGAFVFGCNLEFKHRVDYTRQYLPKYVSHFPAFFIGFF